MDSTDNRLAYILLALCSTPAISSGTLAEKLRVSERTVSNDIKQLETELKDCATIRNNQGKYALHVFDAVRFRAVRAGILAEEIGSFLRTDIPVEEQLFTLLPVVGMRTPADVSEMRSIQLDPAMRICGRHWRPA